MSISGASTTEGANIVQNTITGTGTTAQQWEFVPETPVLSTSTYALINPDNYSVTASGGGMTAGTPLIQYTYSGASDELWNVESLGSGQYSAIGMQSGLALTVTGNSSSSGAQIELNTYADTTDQLFTLQGAVGSYDNLIFVNSGKAMSVSGGSTSSGADIVQEPLTGIGTSSQQWEFTPAVASGSYALTDFAGLALSAGGTTSGSALIEWPFAPQQGQTGGLWDVTPMGNGQYSAIGVQSDLSINVRGNSSSAGAQIQISPWADTNNELFTLQNIWGNWYYVLFVNSGMAMTVSGGSTNEGTDIVQEPLSVGTADEQWEFTPCSQ
jgi:hypothetical protein